MEIIRPIKIQTRNHSRIKENLTSTEMGKLWAIYMGNTMSKCVLDYYLQHIEDQDIKKIVVDAKNLCDSFIQSIREIYSEENFPIPLGFTEEDVNLGAPRLFSDEFYLHYLKYTAKAGLSIYSIAIPLITRKDIIEFFINCLDSTVKLITDINTVLLEKGFIMKPPPIPVPEKVEFVKKQNYLNGLFGNIRPLHALEITHLYDNIENNVTSKALLIAFSQVAKTEQVRQYMLRGKEITNKHVELCSEHMHKANLPSPSLLDHLVSASTVAPFSDKLMLFHKIDMFSMKIRSYGNGASLSSRHDLGAMYGLLLKDLALYVEDGANVMIERGWMEQLPEAIDRDSLSSK